MLVFWAIDSAFSRITLIETATPDFLFSLNQSVRSFSSSGYAGRRYRFARWSFGASLSFSLCDRHLQTQLSSTLKCFPAALFP